MVELGDNGQGAFPGVRWWRPTSTNLVAADAAFYSAKNEAAAKAKGVKLIADKIVNIGRAMEKQAAL
jgi:hypothetical protein